MKRIPHQLMELNSIFIWHWSWLVQGVERAKQHGYTGIILHQQELLSLLVTPSPLSQRLQVGNLIHQQNYSLQYLKRVNNYLQENNLSFWLQGEAAPSDDIIKRKFPEFSFDEKSAPDFWQRFYSTILDALLPSLPHLSGMILSLTPPAFQTHHWQHSLHQVWSQLRVQGKKLILRDFIDDSWPRQQLSAVLSTLSDDVRASVKATELDYHPGFANHPHITGLPGHKKWIEYDLWGIGYGWTILPCWLSDEIAGRLSWAIDASGSEIEAVTSRVSWQWLPDSWVMDSVNAINLIGLTAANQMTDGATGTVFDCWTEQYPLRFRHRQDRQRLAMLFHSSHDWLCKVPNLLGRRLHDQSQIPHSFAQAQQLLHMDTRSANWLQAYQPLFPADDRAGGDEQRQLIALEKEAACFLSAGAVQTLRELTPRISGGDETLAVLLAAWRNGEMYSQMFARVTAAVTDLLWCDRYGESAVRVAADHQQTLLRYADTVARWVDKPPAGSPLHLPLLLSPERLILFARSLTLSH